MSYGSYRGNANYGRWTQNQYGDLLQVPSTYNAPRVAARAGIDARDSGFCRAPGCTSSVYNRDSTVDDFLPEEGQICNAQLCTCLGGTLACVPGKCNRCADHTIVQREAYFDPRGCCPRGVRGAIAAKGAINAAKTGLGAVPRYEAVAAGAPLY